MNPIKLETFTRTYAATLAEEYAKDPSQYCWPIDQLEVVTGKMVAAIAKGTFNKGSASFRRTCKALGIAHTYKAINVYLERCKPGP